MANEQPFISIVILTYNRGELVSKLVDSVLKISYQPLEVIVVDNCSAEPARDFLKNVLSAIQLIELDSNQGATGRNRGIEKARGEIIVTIDDDIYGLDAVSLRKISDVLSDESVGAVCFKVVSPDSHVINWCHHYSIEEYSEKSFVTNEITEGAVAFRRDVLTKSGLYPERFFISHEGPDLAYRIMNQGYNVVYCPDIRVVHHYSPQGRPNWRRYYYDTRNLLWLAVRNYRLTYGIKWVSIGVGAMFVYAIRDGFLRYWGKGLVDGILGLGQAFRERTRPTDRTWRIVCEIEKNRPRFWMMVKKRLFRKGVRI